MKCTIVNKKTLHLYSKMDQNEGRAYNVLLQNLWLLTGTSHLRL